jgi:hypothetical protein
VIAAHRDFLDDWRSHDAEVSVSRIGGLGIYICNRERGRAMGQVAARERKRGDYDHVIKHSRTGVPKHSVSVLGRVV